MPAVYFQGYFLIANGFPAAARPESMAAFGDRYHTIKTSTCRIFDPGMTTFPGLFHLPYSTIRNQ